MKSRNQGIEQLAIRQVKIADTDKVRYRVYSTPTEFIAVIAESALMAVKVSGIRKPHKIVRDLPTEGIAIEAKKIAAAEAKPERIMLPVERGEEKKRLITEVAPKDVDAKQALFKPMMIGDLQRKGLPRARILPPELLSEIIEEHTKSTAPVPPVADVELNAPIIPPLPDAAAIAPEDKLRQMADEMLPPSASLPSAEEKELSPEEVEKLLNG